MEKKIIEFKDESSPSIKDYSVFAEKFGPYPHVQLVTYDDDGNWLIRADVPKYIVSNKVVKSIIWDLGYEDTGFIILS